MKKLSLILFSLSILFFTNYSQTEEKLIYGKAKVIDGDTIKINGKNIRLQGIDAPEMKQSCKDQNNSSYACGHVSKNFLEGLIKYTMETQSLKKVYCYYSEIDRYKRILGECFVGPQKKNNLNKMMVISGNAVAYLRYSHKYAKEAVQAKLEKKGIWSGKFMTPENWRRKNK